MDINELAKLLNEQLDIADVEQKPVESTSDIDKNKPVTREDVVLMIKEASLELVTKNELNEFMQNFLSKEEWKKALDELLKE